MDERERPPNHWKPAATTLRRAVPVAQKRHAYGLTVALSFLEIHEGGNGFVRFLMCQDRPTRRRALTSPGLEIRVRDGSGYVDVEVVRIVELDMFGYPREEGPTWEGPWTFRFRV